MEVIINIGEEVTMTVDSEDLKVVTILKTAVVEASQEVEVVTAQAAVAQVIHLLLLQQQRFVNCRLFGRNKQLHFSL